MRGPRPASKYHALKWLMFLQGENYQTKFFVEYNSEEVDEMVILKQMRKADEMLRRRAIEMKREAQLYKWALELKRLIQQRKLKTKLAKKLKKRLKHENYTDILELSRLPSFNSIFKRQGQTRDRSIL